MSDNTYSQKQAMTIQAKKALATKLLKKPNADFKEGNGKYSKGFCRYFVITRKMYLSLFIANGVEGMLGDHEYYLKLTNFLDSLTDQEYKNWVILAN